MLLRLSFHFMDSFNKSDDTLVYFNLLLMEYNDYVAAMKRRASLTHHCVVIVSSWILVCMLFWSENTVPLMR